MNAKEIVDRIHGEKAKNDSNSQDLARTLNVLSKTVFGDVNRFVFELLQNADDSSLGVDQDIDVEFHLLDNYLVFSHNGAHFTKEDVVGISGIGNKASKKDKSIEKTGYKGIGFKSVFGSSDYAHILSGGFSFRFDKNYAGYGGSDDYPWQVIPIWTDSPADEISGRYDPSRVNTIIGVKNRKAIKSEVVKVFKDCQILLFLRRVNSITFFDKDDTVFQISKSVLSGDIIDLYSDSELVSSWIIKAFDLPINDDLSRQLNQLSEAECPQKLKEATNTKITFAASVGDNIFLPLKAAVIYSYLPTKAEMGFPFLVNGDFLTNAERTDLLPNIWNEFLFAEIAARQLDWFAELQLTDLRYEILKLLKGKYPLHSISDIEKSYNTSLESAAKSVAFLPEQDSEYLLTTVNGIIDSTQFCELFSPDQITSFLKTGQSQGVIDLRVESQNALIGLGAKQFVFSQVLELITTGSITDTIGATNIIVFFYNRTIDGKNSSWLTNLREASFIMDESGGFKTPKEIFFPLKGNSQADDIDFETLSFVHSNILSHFSSSPSVIDWLQQLGVKEPTGLEIVKKSIIPLIRDNKITEHNAVDITRFIFRVYISRLLSDSDYDNLRSLKLLCTNGLKMPAQCYLSDKFNPEKKLSAIIPNANFILDTYPEDEEDIPEWKAFFKKMGVRENITIEIIEEKTERKTFGDLHPEGEPYFKWLEKNIYFPEIYHTWRFSGQHYIQNFTAIDFRVHLGEFEFSKFFWGKMLANWDLFIQKCANTTYYYRNGQETVPSFVEYYIKNFDSIPCTDGKCYRSTMVFSPTLKPVVGNYFPVADLSATITAEQADFFGFKRRISIAECLELLNKISAQAPTSDLRKQAFAIYDQLISQSSETASTVKPLVSKWRKNGKLLTLNNTFQPVEKLYCFNVLGTNAPINSERFVKLPLNRSFDEIKALCDLMQISVITFDLLKFVPEGVVTETILPKAILSKAKFLALIHAHNSNDDFAQVLSRLRLAISETQFLQAEKLNLIYQLEDGEVIFNSKIDSWDDKGTKFYFTGKWSSAMTLYGLSSTVCALLGYKGMEREFGLVLQSSEEEIYEWLSEKGYKIEDAMADDSQEEIFSEYNNDEISPETDAFEGLDIQIEESFIPKVRVDDIDFQDVHPEIKILAEPLVSSHQEYKRITNKKVTVDIGKWSGNFVYNYLQENPETFSNIKWLNKDAESYLPYDFEVIEKGLSRFIEVKGTPSLTKEVVELSPAEWKMLFDHGPSYTMFRVFGAGTADYRFERTDNLRSLIESGKIMPSPILLLI